MRKLEAGHRLNPTEIGPIASVSNEPIRVDGELGPTPLGFRYRASHAGRPLLVSIYDRELLADPLTRRRLEQGLVAATSASHPRLLATHGFTLDGVLPFAVHDDPRCTTVSEFVQRRLDKAKLPSLRTAMRLVDQVCEACAYLHPKLVHGLISGRNAFVDARGQLTLFGIGEGGAAWRSFRYEEEVAQGRLPRPGDEVDPSREPAVATDVYLIAALMLEVLTGRVYQDPRQLDVLRSTFARDGVALLRRALSASPADRPRSVQDFHAELAAAMAATPAQARGSSMSRVSQASALTRIDPGARPMHPGGPELSGAHAGFGGPGPHPMHPAGRPELSGAHPGFGGPGGPPHGQFGQHPPGGPSSSGSFARAPSSGPYGQVPNTGPYAPVPETGPYGQVPNTGPYGRVPPAASYPGGPPPEEISLSAAEEIDGPANPYAGTTIGPATDPSNPQGYGQAPPPRPPGPPIPPGSGPPAGPFNAAHAPAPGPAFAGGGPELSLDLDALDDLAGRLESLDGEDEDHFVPTDGIDNASLSGSFTPEADGELDEEALERRLQSEDPALQVYLHIKDGVERGPFSARRLIKMAESGELASVDDLLHRQLDQHLVAAMHPRLRPIFLARAQAEERQNKAVAQMQAKAKQEAQHSRKTAVWILLIVVLFAGAAAFIVLR